MPAKKHSDNEKVKISTSRAPHPQKISVSDKSMIATAHYRATEAGIRVFEKGGNAVDAAVAAAFALGVCEPQASGLGGQTMMILYLAEGNKLVAIDGTSRAPNRALREDFSRETMRLNGYKATTIPSTPATLGYVLERYGSMKLADVLLPAIELAENGYEITKLQRTLQRRELKSIRKGNAADIFLQQDLRPYKIGQVFKQPALAKTLARLAEAGIEDFYTGQIGETIIDDMKQNGGLIQHDDLGLIPYPIEREPVNGRLGNMIVHTMPPPGSGRTLIEMINILKKFPLKVRNPDNPEGALLLAEIMRRAQLDRRDRPFESNFYPQVQDERMLSSEYATLVSKQIRARINTKGETTHLSVMDKKGNAVSLTQSIEQAYGAKVATPSLGFLYNNYMSAFEHEDVTSPHYFRPNGVPWSNVAPTIIFRSKRPWLVIGSPGSDRIPSAIVQILIRLGWQSPFDAVAAPRMHASYDGKVSLEASYIRDDIPKLLKSRGFKIDIREPMSFYLGCIQLVMKNDEEFIGVADPRRDGSAGGPVN